MGMIDREEAVSQAFRRSQPSRTCTPYIHTKTYVTGIVLDKTLPIGSKHLGSKECVHVPVRLGHGPPTHYIFDM